MCADTILHGLTFFTYHIHKRVTFTSQFETCQALMYSKPTANKTQSPCIAESVSR